MATSQRRRPARPANVDPPPEPDAAVEPEPAAEPEQPPVEPEPEPEQPQPTEPRRPRNVIEAIAAVMAEIGGVPKLTQEQRRRAGQHVGETGISYAYRGIDQIAAAAQPLFGKYGVVITPSIVDCRVEHFELNNRPWTDHHLTVEWTIYGPGDPQTDWILATTQGIGRDNSDKGANKALTGARKNLLLTLLCIGDPRDDPDNERHESTSTAVAEPEYAPGVEVIVSLLNTLQDKETRRLAKLAMVQNFGPPTELVEPELIRVAQQWAANFVARKVREAAEAAAAGDAPAAESPPEDAESPPEAGTAPEAPVDAPDDDAAATGDVDDGPVDTPLGEALAGALDDTEEAGDGDDD